MVTKDGLSNLMQRKYNNNIPGTNVPPIILLRYEVAAMSYCLTQLISSSTLKGFER
jgi:hypothetical protein